MASKEIKPGSDGEVTVSDGTETNISNCSTSTVTENEAKDPGGVTAATEQEQISSKEEIDNCDVKSSGNSETVSFKLIYNKQKFDVTFPLDNTIAQFKEHCQTLTGVPPAMQKIMYKGMAKDSSTLRELKVVKSAKVMVVGSTLNDVLSVNAPTSKEAQEEEKASAATKEAFSEQKQHKKVLDKYGKPDDAIVGIKNSRQPLPPTPVSGMYNKSGGKVRLTFKLEVDQVWLGTKERTEKLPMNSIKAVVHEPIVGHEEYHLMGLQLGPTEASRYWIYWVPAQYVDAIKDTVLGKWQYF